MIVTGDNLAEAARNSKYDGVSYEEMDCQSFVEHVLTDVGIKHNWRGSNDMYRNMVEHVMTVQECKNKNNGIVPAGYICFSVRTDGKEDKKIYKDGINAAHVGIVLDNEDVRHSTTGGVQYDTINNGKRWNYVAQHKDIFYGNDDPVVDGYLAVINLLDRAKKILEGMEK